MDLYGDQRSWYVSLNGEDEPLLEKVNSGLFFLSVSPGRASLHGKASLQIDPVRSEDQGWYECRVLMLEQQYDTFHNGSWVHLTVNGVSPIHARCLVSEHICLWVWIENEKRKKKRKPASYTLSFVWNKSSILSRSTAQGQVVSFLCGGGNHF